MIPDVQIPYQHPGATAGLIRFIGEYKPDEVVQIGDLMDFPGPSRWSKNTAAEFEPVMYEHCHEAKTKFLEPLRSAYSGPIGVIEGNHDLRPREYLSKYAPALAGSDAFNIETLLSFEDYAVRRLPDFYEIAPEWIATHGHLGGIRTSMIAGNSALSAARKFGRSVIMGHTHRLGMCSETTGLQGHSTTRTGVEVGHIMDTSKATYLKGYAGNWQMGFAILHVRNNAVTPVVVPITPKGFIVDGCHFGI